MIKYNGNNAINDWNLGDINITKAYYNGSVCYEKMESGSTPPTPPTPTPSYSGQYLTFTATESGTFKFSGNSIDCSLDNGNTWTTLESDTDSPTVTSGSKIMWKAELTPQQSLPFGIGTFSSTANFVAEGNPLSLLYGDNFIGVTDLTGKSYAFYNLFKDCSGLTSAENISLPATTLAEACYQSMFSNCANLEIAPELPATTLAEKCYQGMFSSCSSLTTAPSLPATTLADSCYRSMFYGCTSLETAPSLPATTLASSCYYSMFSNCTSLTTAPQLPATTLADRCYYQMFGNCTSLTTAPSLPATTLTDYCYERMFMGCTSLVTAPVIDATTIPTETSGSCRNMFSGCTSLTASPVLSAATLASFSYRYMFKGCTSLSAITCLATDISAKNSTNGWASGVAASGTFTKASSMSSWTTGPHGIPSGWTVVDATS